MIYDLFRMIFSVLFKLLFRCEVSGLDHIPERNGVIIAANHVSNWDPPFMAAFLARDVHFMAKQELFEVPLFGSIIRKMHAFPVKRGAADRGAIKRSIQILQEGACLGLFPEGTRSKDGAMKNPEAGIALIALKAGVPVVPAALVGTNKIFAQGCLFPKVKVVYGKPLQIDPQQTDKAALQAFSQRIMDEIQLLLKAAE